jgi:hypothetical protein
MIILLKKQQKKRLKTKLKKNSLILKDQQKPRFKHVPGLFVLIRNFIEIQSHL